MDRFAFINLASKTFWIGVAMVGFGIYTTIATGDPEAGMTKVMEGLGFIFLRDAVAKL